MNTLNFINKISIFSIISWCFFFIAIISAIVITTLHSQTVRRYRKTLISITFSSLLLGLMSYATPLVLRKFNPDHSRLTPIDQLPITEWTEPVSNPENEPTADEIAWLHQTAYHFKYKLNFLTEVTSVFEHFESTLVVIDLDGNLRGFDAYTGINHWTIQVQLKSITTKLLAQKKLYVLSKLMNTDALLLSCFDLQNPALLWQRTIPNSTLGNMIFDTDNQSVVISTGQSGIWSLKSRTGEILWKRPEIFSQTPPILSSNHLIIFEPSLNKKSAGSWHTLDANSGHTFQKSSHVFPNFDEWLLNDKLFLARGNQTQIIAMNADDLKPLWNFNLNEKVEKILLLNDEQYLIFYESHLLEKRNLKDNSLIWQKIITNVLSHFIKISPDHQNLILKSNDGGMSFYDALEGNYLFTALTTEPLIDLSFFGDWLFLLSENHLWSFQKERK